MVGAKSSDRAGELHVHTTTEIKGATVLPAWFVPLLVLCLCLALGAGGAISGVLAWKVHSLEREVRLLQDYTEGRIDHLPYRGGTITIEEKSP